MPTNILLYRCALISPSDVSDERAALRTGVEEWNAHVGRDRNLRVEMAAWESHATPDLSESAQDVINRQLIDSCELGVAIFWSRLGTRTRCASSGSLEEIQRIVSRGGRVMVYFCTRDVPQAALEDEQFLLLKQARVALRAQGLCGDFVSCAELKAMFCLHLTSAIDELQKVRAVEVVPSRPEGRSHLAEPFDLRVRVSAPRMVGAAGGVPEDVIQVRVENRSARDAFVGSVFFKCRDGRNLLPMSDFATGEFQRRRVLRPREAFHLIVGPDMIRKHCPLTALLNVGVYDDLAEEYMASEAEFRRALIGLGAAVPED